MYRGYRIVDADSHVLEPGSLWERYIDKRYAAYAPTGSTIASDPWRFHFTLEVAGHSLGSSGLRRHFGSSASELEAEDVRYIPDEKGHLLTYGEAYREFFELGFGPEAYLRYLDWRGLDYIVLYPTLGLPSTAVPGLDPKAAAAIRRAYNDWLYDFCAGGDGRLIGVGALDLRDVDLAILEAERCVRQLGLKSLQILPDPPLDGVPINHAYYDPLWAAIAELGVPLGIHETSMHLLNPPGLSHILQSGISYSHTATAFGLGAMVAALVICGGGICERHPQLNIVFTESSAGWVSTWLWYLDELWERDQDWHREWEIYSLLPPEKPSAYFRRQCFVSAEPEEPGIKYVIEAQGDHNILYNTDFPHPKEAKVKNPADEFLALDGVSDESKRKILSDNAIKLYRLA